MDYQITSGADHSKGIKTVIYGVEGVGKTTLASKLPDPLFIDTEGSTTHFDNIKRLPVPKDWEDLQKMVDFVSEKKPCKTLVIDTFDWAEMAEVRSMLKEYKWKSIESPGYGKGYILSSERIASFLRDLEEKLIDKGINVCLTCHAQVRKFELPEEQGSFDKYELKLGNKTGSRTSPLVKEWADLMLFCNFKSYVIVEETDMSGKSKSKATGGTERVMYATRSAVWDAKNRFGLPDEMPMDIKPLVKVFKKPAKKETAVKEVSTEAKEETAKKEVKKETEKTPKPKAKAKTAAEPEKSEKDKRPLTFPAGVPEEVIQLASAEGFHADDVQQMLYEDKRVKKLNYPLEKAPESFWKSLVSEYDTRWKAKMEKAIENNLPF